jgi:hypothetical protein
MKPALNEINSQDLENVGINDNSTKTISITAVPGKW